MKISFDGFDWDESNIEKSFIKHGITSIQTESLFRSDSLLIFNDIKHSSSEQRFIVLGKTLDNMFLIVAFTFRTKLGKKLLRPISTRPMNKKERLFYEKEISKI